MNARTEAIVYVLAAGLGLYVAYSVFARVKAGAGTVLDAVNPASPNNVVAKAADKLVQVITGDPTASVGSKLYDVLNPNALKADAPVSVGAGRVSPSAAQLVAAFGGSQLTREDQAWMVEQLYGPTVQTNDVDDAELGQWMMASNPSAMAADRLRYAVKP